MSARVWLFAAAIAVSGAFWLLPAAARANTPITAYSALPSTTQAGGHPDLGVSFAIENRQLQGSTSACNCEDAKDATAHLPTGFIGDPHATPRCTIADFSADACPIDSQVGIANIDTTGGGLPFDSAVYNLIPPPDEAGLLGFKIILGDSPLFTVLSARTGSDYGLDAKATSIYHGWVPLDAVQQVVWGVPADPSHDPLRLDPSKNVSNPGTSSYFGQLCDASGTLSTADPSTIVQPCHLGFGGAPLPTPSNSPLAPFLQNPTTCAAPLSSSLDVLSYDGGTTHADAAWPQMTGCYQLSFNPSLFAQPTTTATDSPSGIDVDLEVPQQQSPTVPSPSELRATTVTLPAGFSINPNAADGKTSCTDLAANIGTGSEDAANCPEFSKVGSLTILSSALPGPLPGFVYLGAPLPGNRYRIFLVADGFATHVKLAGTVTPDPVTGQLAATFTNLPESPLTAFNMHFFGSERGVLATPIKCGTYPVKTIFTPWDESLAAQTSTQFFTIDSGPNGAPCPGPTRPFDPSFQAASAGNTAGAHTPFAVELTRSDGDQFLSGLTVTTPPGFSGILKGIPYCPQAAIDQLGNPLYSGLSEIASSACPAASQIGTAVAGAGAGNHPLYVGGKVYLAGPYKGAPLSLVVVIPAVSGPYDLGNVAVRAAIRVDPVTAQVTTVSDPFPQILEGIPLRTRSILVNLDRPGFALNPTNCRPLSTDATVFGDQGAQANISSPFQVANCARLGFAPKLAIKLKGGTKRSANPALTATLTYPEGSYANIKSASVALPHSEFLDQAHIKTICTRVVFAEGSTPGEKCPPGSVYGFAKAETPLLDKPLEGPVYLRSSSHNLPDLVAALNGQIDITLEGRIDTDKHAGIRTTFEVVPDAPVAKFTLEMAGGNKGLLENSEDICAKPQKAIARFTAQNGKVDNFNPTIANSCKKSDKHHKKAGAHR
jgi:hypothetical protein